MHSIGTATAKAHTQPLPPIHSIFPILHSSSPESAGRAVYLQPSAERAARSWRTRTPIRTPMQAAERAQHRNGDSQGPHNHCRPSILHFQFHIPHPRQARDARFIYNRLRSVQRGVGGHGHPQEPRDEPRSACSHGTATAKAHTTTAAPSFYIPPLQSPNLFRTKSNTRVS